MNKLLHINIDGIDGTGKSTVATLLYNTLRRKYPHWDVQIIRESDTRRHPRSLRLDRLSAGYVLSETKTTSELSEQLPWILARARDVEYFGERIRLKWWNKRLGIKTRPSVIIHDRSHVSGTIAANSRYTPMRAISCIARDSELTKEFWETKTGRDVSSAYITLMIKPDKAVERIIKFRELEPNESLEQLTLDNAIYNECPNKIDVDNSTPEAVVVQILKSWHFTRFRECDDTLTLEDRFEC